METESKRLSVSMQLGKMPTLHQYCGVLVMKNGLIQELKNPQDSEIKLENIWAIFSMGLLFFHFCKQRHSLI
jgi:hypothetical protein